MAGDPSNSAALRPPARLSRAEKADFRRLLARRAEEFGPVSVGEADAIADLVSARSRLADLHAIYASAMQAATSFPHQPQQRHAMAVARQLDGATAKVQKMAAGLGLAG